jgi:hypothetical protein
MDVQYDHRLRSDSQLSGRQQPYAASNNNNGNHRPWSNSTATNTPNSTFPPATSRPGTSNQTHQPYNTSHSQSQRQSVDDTRSPRPLSGGTTYYTPRLDADAGRFSGIFNSAVPLDVLASSSSNNHHREYTSGAGAPAGGATSMSRPASPPRVLFVCASLFEFSIDKTRREAGHPYLTYVQGEVFDVIGQKGELWLARNQDDSSNRVGWIWEQHFIILSSES